MQAIADGRAAPPDDGHRGSETTPSDVMQAASETEACGRHPPLHRDPVSPETALGASGPWALILVLVFLAGAGLALVFT